MVTMRTLCWRQPPMPEDKRERLKQWLERGEAQLHPLTFSQRELWEASPAPPADVSNHICCVIAIRGLITLEDVRASIQKVVDRQEGLRLSLLPGKSGAVQLVRARGEAVPDFRDVPRETTAQAMEELALKTFHKPFDLVGGPLYRVEVIRRAPDDAVLVFAIHHAIADGWTLGVFVQDLCAAYLQQRKSASEALPPVPTSYSSWGAAERAFWQPAELENRSAFWKTRLTGVRRLWSVPAADKTVFV